MQTKRWWAVSGLIRFNQILRILQIQPEITVTSLLTCQISSFLREFQSAAPVAYSIADAVLPGDEISKTDPQEVLMASKIAPGFRLNWYNFDEAGNQIGLKRAELRPQPLGKVVSSLIKQARE